MKPSHGVAHVSHQVAQVIEFDEGTMRVVKAEQHAHATRQHGSNVRSEHEFFGSVCDQVEAFAKLLVTGVHTAPPPTTRDARRHDCRSGGTVQKGSGQAGFRSGV